MNTYYNTTDGSYAYDYQGHTIGGHEYLTSEWTPQIQNLLERGILYQMVEEAQPDEAKAPAPTPAPASAEKPSDTAAEKPVEQNTKTSTETVEENESTRKSGK